ncbi:MAG TPA: chromate transporter [Ktedonosporobacter sp.]|nr:chromate transporter [Ktedonosporobacter sp.]
MQTIPRNLKPGPWQLFRIWAMIGLQSFGGGTSTVFLIQHEFIEKRLWLTMEEYLLLWNLCLFAPGINLIALTILIGRKLGGVWGIVVSLAGMLLPSGVITCLLTVGFLNIEHVPAVQAILRGVVPATAGIMFLVGMRYAQPLIATARDEGKLRIVISALLILASAAALILLHLSAMLVVIGAAGAGIVLFTSWRTPPTLPACPVNSGEPVASDD